jgi:putative glutamine amidotransferase
MRPLIGLSSYREQARWGVWDTSADLLPTQYAASVEAAGGVPVILPPVDPAAAPTVVARLDGLVISGGADVDPGRYGAEPHPQTRGWRPDRDGWEVALLEAADERGIAVLGVCRGMQVMAVRAGGTLEQHTPDRVGHDQHSPGGDVFGDIGVETAPGSRLRDLVGARQEVGCHHHQAVLTHPGFEAVAFSADGTLEAMERPGDRFCLAVQWHPESRTDAGLFRGLVAAADRAAAVTD